MATVLLVDDDEDIIDFLREIVASLECTVYVCRNVDEAKLRLLETPIDVMFTDFKMPGDTGMELISHVREHYRQTYCVFITGYFDKDLHTFANYHRVEIIQKPFAWREFEAFLTALLTELKTKKSLDAV